MDVVQCESNERNRDLRSETILQNILVLAAGQVFTRREENAVQSRTVTLAVTPKQVDTLVAARTKGPFLLRLHVREAIQGERRVAGASSEVGVGPNDTKRGTAENVRAEEGREAGDSSSTAAGDKDLTTEEIAARFVASVAVIRGKNSVGSGFLVKPGIQPPTPTS